MADAPLSLQLPPSLLNETLGAMLLGAFFTVLFYGILCQQCYNFFQRFAKENAFLRSYVWMLWALASVHAALTIHPVYVLLVTGFGEFSIFLTPRIPWSIPVSILLTTSSDVLVRVLFTYRLWILSEKKRIFLALSGILLLVDFVAGFTLGIKALVVPNINTLNQEVRWLFYFTLTAAAVADLYTSLSLCYFLALKRLYTNRRTYSILNILIIYTINTGLLTSIVCLVAMITHAAMPQNFVFIGVYFPLSGLYSNALLGSLNARDWFRRDTDTNRAAIPLTTIHSPSTSKYESDPSSIETYGRADLEAIPVEATIDIRLKERNTMLGKS